MKSCGWLSQSRFGELEEKIQLGSDHKDRIGPAKECELYPLEMSFKQISKCSGGTDVLRENIVLSCCHLEYSGFLD